MTNLWGTVIAGVIVGGILLILGFGGWLWKRSIYGAIDNSKEDYQKGMSTIREDTNLAIQKLTEYVTAEISRMGNAMSNNYSKKQDSILCDSLRVGCQSTVAAKIISIESKILLLLEQQGQVINRLDTFLVEILRKKE